MAFKQFNNSHLSYAIHVKKLGTILYRSKPQKCNCKCNDPISIENYSDEINTCIHQKIKNYLAADVTIPFEFHQLNIDKLVAEMDPKLWEFVCTITKPVSACKSYTYSSSGEKTHH